MSSFSSNYDAAIRMIESALTDAIDAGAEMDYDRNGDVLNIEFEDGSRFVVTPQAPTEQLWISANYSGFRFNWSDSDESWLEEKSREELPAFLSRTISEKLGEDVRFS